MLNLDSIKNSLTSYFSGTDSPTGKITADLEKFQNTLASNSGIPTLLQKGADQAISGLAKTAASQETKTTVQADGSFLAPDDSTGVSFLGAKMSFATIAVVVGALYFLKR